MTVRPVPDLVEIGVERTGRDLVQQRLPDVGAMAVDEENVDVGTAPVSASQPGGELEPAGTSANDDDLRHRVADHLPGHGHFGAPARVANFDVFVETLLGHASVRPGGSGRRSLRGARPNTAGGCMVLPNTAGIVPIRAMSCNRISPNLTAKSLEHDWTG